MHGMLFIETGGSSPGSIYRNKLTVPEELEYFSHGLCGPRLQQPEAVLLDGAPILL
jgi:hypothetical protein